MLKHRFKGSFIFQTWNYCYSEPCHYILLGFKEVS